MLARIKNPANHGKSGDLSTDKQGYKGFRVQGFYQEWRVKSKRKLNMNWELRLYVGDGETSYFVALDSFYSDSIGCPKWAST